MEIKKAILRPKLVMFSIFSDCPLPRSLEISEVIPIQSPIVIKTFVKVKKISEEIPTAETAVCPP